MGCSRGAARCTAPTPAFVRMARIATTSSASLGLFGVTWYSLMVCDVSPSACCHWASEALEANRQSPAGMRHSACRQSPWTDVFDIDASQRTIKRSKTPHASNRKFHSMVHSHRARPTVPQRSRRGECGKVYCYKAAENVKRQKRAQVLPEEPKPTGTLLVVVGARSVKLLSRLAAAACTVAGVDHGAPSRGGEVGTLNIRAGRIAEAEVGDDHACEAPAVTDQIQCCGRLNGSLASRAAGDE